MNLTADMLKTIFFISSPIFMRQLAKLNRSINSGNLVSATMYSVTSEKIAEDFRAVFAVSFPTNHYISDVQKTHITHLFPGAWD